MLWEQAMLWERPMVAIVPDGRQHGCLLQQASHGVGATHGRDCA